MALLNNETNALLNDEAISIDKLFDDAPTPDSAGIAPNAQIDDLITKIRGYAGKLIKLLKLIKVFTNSKKDAIIDKIIVVLVYIQDPNTKSTSPDFEEKMADFSVYWPTIRAVLEFIESRKITGPKLDKAIAFIIALGNALVTKHNS